MFHCYQVLDFRGSFSEIAEAERSSLLKDKESHLVLLDGYYEDDQGNPLDQIAFTQARTGDPFPILPKNPNSVTRLGPSAMTRKDLWSTERANTLAHFLELTEYIGRSQWAKEEVRWSYEQDHDGGKRLIEFVQPSMPTVMSVLAFIRQLCAPNDKLFRLACDYYCCHVADERKRDWVAGRRKAMVSLLGRKPVMRSLSDETVGEIVNLFLYGFGLIHQTTADSQRFREMLQGHEKEKVLMAFHGSCIAIAKVASQVAPVIEQDFKHWLTTENIHKPDRVTIADLLGHVVSMSLPQSQQSSSLPN